MWSTSIHKSLLSIDALSYLYCRLILYCICIVNWWSIACHTHCTTPIESHMINWHPQISSEFLSSLYRIWMSIVYVLILYYTKPIEADMINQLPLGKLPPPAPAATDRAVSQNFWLSFPLMSGHQSIFHCCRVISEHFPLISGPIPASSTIYSPTLSPAPLPACIKPHCNALNTLLQPLVT